MKKKRINNFVCILLVTVFLLETLPVYDAITNNQWVTILNNYAASGQSLGAVVPYDIKVDVKYTFNAI